MREYEISILVEGAEYMRCVCDGDNALDALENALDSHALFAPSGIKCEAVIRNSQTGSSFKFEFGFF